MEVLKKHVKLLLKLEAFEHFFEFLRLFCSYQKHDLFSFGPHMSYFTGISTMNVLTSPHEMQLRSSSAR